MNLREMVRREEENGLQGDYAVAKVCQDIILLAISKSEYRRSVTIKGGVVIREKTNNIRRSTLDLDIDFIQYPLSDGALEQFVLGLNCIDGISIVPIGLMETLHHQDYQGKRIHILMEDEEGYTIRTKIDVGIHSHCKIEQEEYSFDVSYGEDSVLLLVNSNEQIFTEKLKSLLRFGPFSTRTKDVFDMYYLKDYMDQGKLKICMEEYIFQDSTMKENGISDVVRRLRLTFENPQYVRLLSSSDKKWVDDDVAVVCQRLAEYLENLN